MAAPVVPSLRSELVVALKRLKLGRIVDTLPERLVLADKQDMTFDDLLLLVVTDEITRRDNTAADTRANQARLDPTMRLELGQDVEGEPRQTHARGRIRDSRCRR